MLFSSLGAIIGSGWLFGALYATIEAGPAAILSWLIAGAVILLLALIHAELGGMFPLTGGTARYPQFAFGSVVSFAAGWIAWVGAVTIAPIEVLAVITYASVYLPWLVTDTVGDFGLLSFPAGYIVASALMLLFTVVNLMGVKAFAKSNAALVWFKIAVPTVTVLALLLFAPFDASNFSGGDGFMPAGMQGVLTAISVGGVFFAMFGFEQAIQLGGESSNPRRNIPLSVIRSGSSGQRFTSGCNWLSSARFPTMHLQRGGQTSASPTPPVPTRDRTPAGIELARHHLAGRCGNLPWRDGAHLHRHERTTRLRSQ